MTSSAEVRLIPASERWLAACMIASTIRHASRKDAATAVRKICAPSSRERASRAIMYSPTYGYVGTSTSDKYS